MRRLQASLARARRLPHQAGKCDALVEPAYRSALAYRERDGSTALGAARLWPACPRTRSHIGMGHDPEVPVRDAPERAPKIASLTAHPPRQVGTSVS